MTQWLVILIVSLAAAGLAWWMRRENPYKPSCGPSCNCFSKCEQLSQKSCGPKKSVRTNK